MAAEPEDLSLMGPGMLLATADSPAAAAASNGWHHLYDFYGWADKHGTQYPTRRRLSAALEQRFEDGELINSRVGGLTEQQCWHLTAVHELMHARLFMAAGFHVGAVHLDVTGDGELGGHVDVPPWGADALSSHETVWDWMMAVAAGERAGDRWLREAGLWTPDLAVMTEMGAAHDRSEILKRITPMPTFGTGGEVDYTQIFDGADAAIDPHWETVTASVPAVRGTDRISGDDLADLFGTTNPALRREAA
jgi:hypothetical protein